MSDSILIFLHIEKTAGTSLMRLLANNYGEHNVLWYNPFAWQSEFCKEEIQGKKVLCGHNTRTFYDQCGKRALYLAVVREPLSRAVSLFNYHGKLNPARATWIGWGLNPESLSETLDNCPEFLNEISNRQCEMISGHKSYEQAIAAMNSAPYLVGCMDHLDFFIDYVANLLNWKTRVLEKLNVGESRYSERVEVTARDRQIIDDLNREDRRLYDYINQRRMFVNEDKEHSIGLLSDLAV